MLSILATTLSLDELRDVVTAPNWDGLYESLWGNSAALAVAAVVAVILVLLAFKFLTKMMMKIVVLVLAVLVVLFFAARVAGDAIEINGFKNGDRECGVTMRPDGSWDLDTSCIAQ